MWLPALLSALAALAADVPPTVAARPCDRGERPGYFVPGGPGPIVGCARLGVSGKRVEFSAHSERIGGPRHVCLNPAYRGRGQDGIYIPAVCTRRLSGLRILGAEIPRQAVRGYELVIWGTAPRSARKVVACYRGRRTAGAVFRVGRRLARKAGAPRRFAVFVVELPVRAARRPVVIRAGGATERLR
jgi:hypothetical protein